MKTNKTLAVAIVALVLAVLSGYANTGFAASGSLGSYSPCQIPENETRCSVELFASKSGSSVACIWTVEPVQLVSCSGNAAWNTTWSWANLAGRTLNLKAHDSFPTHDANWPSSMQYIFDSSPLLDEELVFGLASTPNPENIAHRGNESQYLENSLLAFISASHVGADTIEFDVHTTQDGTAIVYHDSVFQRLVTCSEPGIVGNSISQLNFAQIRQNCVYQPQLIGNPSSLPSECQIFPPNRILTIDEALDIAHCLEIGALIEMKDQHADVVFSAIEDHAAANPAATSCGLPFDCMNKLLVQSFHSASLENFSLEQAQSAHPGYSNIRLIRLIGQNYSLLLLDPNWMASLWAWDGVAFYYQAFGLVEVLHAINLMRIEFPNKWIGVYTVHSVPDLHELNRANLDGIITSRPQDLTWIQN